MTEVCDCCENAAFGSPDDTPLCFYCTHTQSMHAEYTGPLGEKYEWTS